MSTYMRNRCLPVGLLLLAALIGLAGIPGALAEMQPLWTTNVGGRIEAPPMVADINGDGKPEIIIGGRATGKLSVLNGANGAIMWEFDGGYEIVRTCAVGDIDADGKPEVLFNTRNGTMRVLNNAGQVVWWKDLSDGDPAVGDPNCLYCPPALADLDKDGKLEVLVGSKDLKKFFVYDCTGALIWEAPIGAIGDNTAAVADIDNDGDLEVVLSSEDENGQLYGVYAWEADGTPIWVYNVYEGDYMNFCASIADMNGDGVVEIVVGGAQKGRVYCLDPEGNENWVFDTGTGTRISKAPLGDLNGDGMLDLVFVVRRTGLVYAFDYEGNQLWMANLTAPVLNGFQPECPAIGDVTGDGKPNVVIGGSDGKIYVLNGADGAIAWSYQAVNAGRFQYNQPAIADLDGDQRAEIVYGDERGNVSVLKTPGAYVDQWTTPWPLMCRTPDNNNYFPREYPLWTVNIGGRIEAPPLAADLNGDGMPEIVVGTRGTGTMFALDGQTGETLWQYYAGYEIYRQPAVGDIDGDGNPEIAFNTRNGTFRVLDNAGKSLWWKDLSDGDPAVGDPNCLYCAPTLADLDKDGKLEILVGSKDLKKFFVYDSAGNLVWDAPIGAIGDNTASVADLDGDGYLDVVLTSEDEGGSLYGVYAWKGDGTPLWVMTPEPGDYMNAAASIADIDLDGYLDIVVGGAHQGRIYCLYDVDGGVKWVFDTGQRVRVSKAQVADLTGGDDLETVFTVRRTGLIHCLDSKGDLLWTTNLSSTVLNGFQPEHPIVGDVTGDGEPEVIMGGSNGRVYVLSGDDGRIIWTFQAINAGRLQFNNAVIVDLDQDGVSELIFGDEKGNVSVLATPGVYGVETPMGLTLTSSTPWPYMYRNVHNTNYFGVPEAAISAVLLLSLGIFKKLWGRA
jgi:outer membrane protein assembly factor BamB